MKKTLLSVLAGLTVIGSASAAPTPEDRKALCQLLIDKGTHVWVEKTSACIPVNPCLSDGEIYNAYCTFFSFPADENNIKTIIDAYTKKRLGVEAIDYKYLDSDSDDNDHYHAVKTSDNGYFVANFFAGASVHGCIAAVSNSLKVNGYEPDLNGYKSDNNYNIKDPTIGGYKTQYDEKSNKFKINVTDSACEEIRSFASSLIGEQINRDSSSQLCVLVCPD